MAVETAADLAGMFDTDEFAESAQYTAPAGGDPVDCLVIVDRGQGRQPFRAGEQQASSSERMLWAQKSELATVQRDGLFAMFDAEGEATGEVFKVAGEPKLDQLAALWSAELLIVS